MVDPVGGGRLGASSGRQPGETEKQYKARLKAEKAAAAAQAKFAKAMAGYRNDAGVLYYGVDKGTDLENLGVQREMSYNLPFQKQRYAGYLNRPVGPRYKVGYLNSKEFLEEKLYNKNEKVIQSYQEYMYAAGLLKEYQPGKLDKHTKAAFKDLLTTANQTGDDWQNVLRSALTSEGALVGSEGAAQERDPFQAVLADPVLLRETFQKSVQDIYGGDLPDEEVNAMVDAFRSQQMSKQQAAYNAEGQGGVVESTEMSPEAFATAQVKAKHPQQLDRVKFQDTFSSIMKTFGGG